MNNEDIHLSTAAKIFGVSPENVTKQMRSDAKAINFGIIYGMEAFGLSRRTGMSAADSRSFIDNYFQLYPGIRKFIENIKVKAKNDGYVTTLLNRRRYLPEIQSKDQNIRKFGERTAINTVIQGTAADLIKVAMIQIHQWIQRNKYETLMILQVHDELVFDVPKKELENVKKNVKLLMESAFPDIHVPLKVDVGAGENWFEAH
jgi:DNA polymerase-1